MATVENYKCSNFAYVFNQGDTIGKIYPKKEQKESFEILNGDQIETYSSTNNKSSVLKLIKSSITPEEVECEFDVIEPQIIHDYNLVSDCIVSKLNVEKEQIEIAEVKVLKRDGKKTTYTVRALIYPRLLTVLNNKFSLNDLYLEYLRLNDVEKSIIKNFIQQLIFVKKSSFDVKIIDDKRVEQLKQIGVKFDMVTDKVKDANKNTCLIQMFNLNDDIFDIDIKQTNYVDKDLEESKRHNSSKTNTIKKKFGNIYK